MKLRVTIVLATIATAVHAAQLQCPDATQIMTKAMQQYGVRIEWCEDRNGLKQGPLRYVREKDGAVESDHWYRFGKKDGVSHYYNDDGTLKMGVYYSDGKETGTRLSAEGSRLVIEHANTAARKAGKTWHFTITNERTLQLDYIVEAPAPFKRPDFKEFALHLLSSDGVCSVLLTPELSFESVLVRYSDKRGELLLATTLKTDECNNVEQR